MVIKIHKDGDGNTFARSAILRGIDYAVEKGADILSMSFGGTGAYATNYFKNIAAQGVIPISSAGNEGDASVRYPASDPYVIGVGALAYNSWALASFSSYGVNTSLVAPGTSIYTTAIGGGYKYINGTSFSCPTVSAAVGLYLAANGKIAFDPLCEALYDSCLDIGAPGEDG